LATDILLMPQVPLYGSFINAFRNVRSTLADNLDVSHGLIDALWSHGVLEEWHVSEVMVGTVLCSQSLHRVFSANAM